MIDCHSTFNSETYLNNTPPRKVVQKKKKDNRYLRKRKKKERESVREKNYCDMGSLQIPSIHIHTNNNKSRLGFCSFMVFIFLRFDSN